ncbi:hypothetical protein CI088_11900 [Enterococcus plantarum]|uniref:Uncharacterized protein n=1 Tax=Enterococcus plantarum TaxID=1077675 RepID=A0A2W3YUV9_9ENTE|nr:hypothetical protein [Enterococcus plantarum]PZL71698.1 hypothetical protein CI088_11900 [Enterococcus plantarum]
MTKSEIFTTAWELAKQGASKFGGSSKEYFAEALKIAYKKSNRNTTVVVTLELSNDRISNLAKSIIVSINKDMRVILSKIDEKRMHEIVLRDLTKARKVEKIVNATDDQIVASMANMYIKRSLQK